MSKIKEKKIETKCFECGASLVLYLPGEVSKKQEKDIIECSACADCVDPHLGCPSYPCCDLNPLGCHQQTASKDIEWYGHRD